MPALSPLSLAAACRAIYVQAAEGAVLPPLIRDAAEPAPPQRMIEASGADFSIVFRAVYAEPGRDAEGRPERPPLRFEIEATAGPDEIPVDLTADERFALVRAFFLGVQEPVAVDAPANGADWRIGFKISARFTIWVAEPVRLDVGLSTDEIAERLAERLMEETRCLFATPRSGRDVWTARLRQELFADRPPHAHEIWPIDGAAFAPAPIGLFAPPRASRPDAPRRTRRVHARAIAAAVALIGLAALAGAVASHGANGEATFGPRAIEMSQSDAIRPAVLRVPDATPAAVRQAAPLSDHAAWSPGASDVRLALLAPDVAAAARALSPAAIAVVASTPAPVRLAAIPTRPNLARDSAGAGRQAVERDRPAVRDGKAGARPRAHVPSPLAHVDRAVRKLVKSVARRLPHLKISGLNSPNAAGPRRP